jgi:L-threonylcarbamoyladenylate synthase
VAGLGDRIDLIVDGGACQVGIESTVLDLSSNRPRILRPGGARGDAIARALGISSLTETADENGSVLKSPGMLARHYAPRTRLEIWEWSSDRELIERILARGMRLEQTHVLAHTRIPADPRLGRVVIFPFDAEAYGRALYSELHRCDAEGGELIIVEKTPDDPEWSGIADRLRRAATSEP